MFAGLSQLQIRLAGYTFSSLELDVLPISKISSLYAFCLLQDLQVTIRSASWKSGALLDIIIEIKSKRSC